jgi:hypothetical protein
VLRVSPTRIVPPAVRVRDERDCHRSSEIPPAPNAPDGVGGR